MRRTRRQVGIAGVSLALAVLAAAAGPSRADLAKAPEPFAIPMEHGKPLLGAGYDSALGSARGEPGACVGDAGTDRNEDRSVRYSLATLTRAGGRLVVGVSVAVVTATESLSTPRLIDASRRLAQSDSAAFHDLCGDGFVARVELGGHWLGELEIAGTDVARATAGLTTGSWSDAEPFRSALESLTKRFRATARELPGGSRAEARDLAPDALVERAIAFPETVTSENEKPCLAIFAGYETAALSGMPLPMPGEIDARMMAEQILRGGPAAPSQSRASRAAEMRLAQAHPDSAAETAAGSSESHRPPVDLVLPPAAPAPAAEIRRSGDAAQPVVSKQAALVFEAAGAPPVYATTRAPAGVHAEHVRERFYWVPGAAAPTPPVVQAIAAARAGSPVRGTTVALVEVGARVVVLTDAPPIEGVFSEPAGEQRAWIAGVSAPDAEDRKALAAAIQAL